MPTLAEHQNLRIVSSFIRCYRVIRFWYNELLSNTEEVLLMIFEAPRASPPTSQR